uniref:Ycf36 n=1 Tax=Palmaria palmata TaxID=2822 RepID=A0A1C9CGX5_PALPL|nr:hypothetical protein Palma_018 [Palmaria palmata]AOM67650.1 hypothetical protein Palma_018 [Palmaria palmata]
MSPKPDFCPVPFDQQPINEYEALKKSPLFNWSTTTNNQFFGQLLLLFTLFYCIGISINWSIIVTHKLSALLLINSLIFSVLIIEIIMVRLYLGWSYVFKRLASATIFYEESGWYDGQLWIKSATLLTQDRLIGIYQVKPVLLRVKNIFFITSVILLSTFIISSQVL